MNMYLYNHRPKGSANKEDVSPFIADLLFRYCLYNTRMSFTTTCESGFDSFVV